MSRPPPDANVRLLYRSTFLFGLACGISIALTSLHLDAQKYSKIEIGWLAVWFASGIVAMALPAGILVRKFSAKHTLVACMLSYAVCVAAFPFLPSYAAIAVVRFFDGASSVGIWVSSETILLSRTRNEDKAHYTSLYAIWLASGYVVGPGLAWVISQFYPTSLAFVVSGAFALGAAALLAGRLDQDGQETSAPADAEAAPPPELPTSAGTILWRIKCSCFATYAYGYFQASVVIFLPLYLMQSKGIEKNYTIILPGLFSLGMLLFSNPAGRVGDRIGHLRVMRVLGVVGTLMILGFVFLDAYWLMCVAVFLAGSTLAAMSPVSLALQGVITEKKNYSRSNAIYNVFYASGMLMGPQISSRLFEAYGGKAMLYHLAALYVAFVIFCVVFRNDDPAALRAAERERHAQA